MNKNVVEIINYLIKAILNSGELGLDANEMIEDLLDMGYNPEDIDTAFELIFSSEEEIIDLPSDSKENNEQKIFRAFTLVEKLLVDREVQGILLKLVTRGLISQGELDKILHKVLHYPYFPVSLKDLGILLSSVIQVEGRLQEIVEEIPDLNDHIFDYRDEKIH